MTRAHVARRKRGQHKWRKDYCRHCGWSRERHFKESSHLGDVWVYTGNGRRTLQVPPCRTADDRSEGT